MRVFRWICMMGTCSASNILWSGANLLDTLRDEMRDEFDIATFDKVDELVEELFALHDIADDGTLSEDGLIRLNEKISMLHCGEVDRNAVKAKYRNIFRSELDPQGKPVRYTKFHRYMIDMLEKLDRDSIAQEMIIESLIMEARLGRAHL
mmetsp:Transcript_6215/g.17344  ORF Transcript_6215/g.17344 Transcript_6215/m.17344 type:complete len:150 (-) Transcript_6215:407-856(-)